MSHLSSPEVLGRIKKRRKADKVFLWVMAGSAVLAVLILLALLTQIGIQGSRFLGPTLFNNYPDPKPEFAGAKHAIFGTLWLMGLTLLFTVPVGVGAAVYLQEFNPRNNWFTRFVNLNIANLAGVPSIVYGMLGLAMIVPFVAQLAGDPKSGKTLLAGSLTMSLLVLPVVILVAQEALKAVPSSYRDGSLALGATRWQTIRKVILPHALPGVMTGIILAASRAIGETAPLIVVGAAALVTKTPDGVFSPYGVLPLQVFDWAKRPQQDFKDLSASTIIILLGMLIILNSIAIFLRARAQSKRA